MRQYMIIICLNMTSLASVRSPPQVNPNFLNYAAPCLPYLIALQNCLSSLSLDRPIKQIKSDILALVQKVGPEAEKLAITALLESIEQSEPKDKQVLAYRSSLLCELLKQFSSASQSFLSYFPEALVKSCQSYKLSNFLSVLFTNLKLSLPIQLSMALSLYLSDRPELQSLGENELVNKIKEWASSQKPSKISQKMMEELLFQININPQLATKLEVENKVLLQNMEKMYKSSETRIYNYFRDEWQYFANETPALQKIQPVLLKKADILRDLGPSVSQQMDTLKAIISEIGPLGQEDIFECLMMMSEQRTKHDSSLDRFVIDLMYASSTNNSKKNVKGEQLKRVFSFDGNNSKTTVSWNTENFLLFVTQNIQNIKWQNVLANLDRENLQFVSDEHFAQMMKILDKVKKLVKKWLPSDSIIFKKWAHPESQFEFLIRLFNCKDPECIFFNDPVQPKKGSQNASKQINNSPLRQIWGSVQLLTLLFQVSENKRERIRHLFDVPISKYPDILLKTLSEVKPATGEQFVNEIYSRVLPQFLQNDAKSTKQLQILWKNNKQLLVQTITDLQNGQKSKRSQLDLQKLVQIFQTIEGSLDQIIVETDLSLALPVALIAAKKESINLQRWISAKLTEDQPNFCRVFLQYLEDNLLKQLRAATQGDQKQSILQQCHLNIETLNRIFTSFSDKLKSDYPNSKNHQLFKKMQKQICKLIPEIAQGQLYEQAERQCEQEIKKIYRQQITIQDAVDNLKRLKNSNKKQQMENFANRITFLCIELTYHHSYPEKELMITADLFSALINANLMQKKIYQTFLHVIDEYLKQDSQLSAFAMKVMANIKEKLAHETWFCEKLVDNEIVMRKDPELVDAIIKSIEPSKILSIQKQRKIKEAIRIKNLPPPETFSRRIIIETEVHHHIQVSQKPETSIQFDILATLDKTKKIDLPDRESKLRVINTICNTLSLTNVDEKAKELKKALDNEKTIMLLAYSLVFKRITITNNINGIQVFVKLIENLGPKIQKPVMKVTYEVLEHWFELNGKSPSNDKKFGHFRNIGAWLGRITIGKGVPIPIHKLHIRELLTKSYLSNNRLAFIIPTVLRILEPLTINPDILQPQSPWLRRILHSLSEVEQNLKEQTQSQSLQPQNQPPVNYHQLKQQIKAFFKSCQFDAQVIFASEPSIINTDKQISINEILRKLTISSELNKYCEMLDLKNVKVLLAKILDVSILDIVEPVIDRTVKIAMKTTKCMVSKDLSTQARSDRYKQSCISLIKQLAAPLAQITCRQPLKSSINKNIRDYLLEHSHQLKLKQEQSEILVQKILQQIIELGCQLIRDKVSKSAEIAIKSDPQFLKQLEIRMLAQKEGRQVNGESLPAHISNIVPKQLRAGPNGLTQEQYAIYAELKSERKIKQGVHKVGSLLAQQEPMLELLEQKQPQSLQKLKKLLQQSQSQPSQQFLHRLHTLLLDPENNEFETVFYLKVCQEIKSYSDQNLCWKLFKEAADIKGNEDHQRIVKKLVRDKYFDDCVIGEIMEVQTEVVKIFEEWIQITKQKVPEFIENLNKRLVKLECNYGLFFFYCFRYVLNKFIQETHVNTECFNPLFCEQFTHLLLSCFTRETNNDLSLLVQQIMESILNCFLKQSHKHTMVNLQRPLFKVLTNMLEYLHCERLMVLLQLDSDISKDKISLFVCTLLRKLNKINPQTHPKFAAAWLQLICSKYIIKTVLDSYEDWDLYFMALCHVLRFLNQNITEYRLYNAEYGEIYQTYYQAVLKLIVILTHDYSSFISAFSLELCLLVDARFIQLKNIINSAYPLKELQIPLKFEKREDLQQFVQKVGYPKYYKLVFDKQKLSRFISQDPNDPAFKDTLAQQDDLFVQTLILYFGWLQQNGLTQLDSTRKLTDLLLAVQSQPLRSKLLSCIINLIRYPNHITLFFIDFVAHLVFKQSQGKDKEKDSALREMMLNNIVTRMKGEVPIAWGLIYLVNNVLVKDKLSQLGLPHKILDQF